MTELYTLRRRCCRTWKIAVVGDDDGGGHLLHMKCVQAEVLTDLRKSWRTAWVDGVVVKHMTAADDSVDGMDDAYRQVVLDTIVCRAGGVLHGAPLLLHAHCTHGRA